ncbi:LysE family translocator [Hypericibacter sp.]|uniref:LysE family translocator n=1 Tax=Hypericibacter sp. TaxID=2705401 RepID=UPI003D6DA15D
MPSFLPDLATLLPFLAAALALNLTPGADMTMVLAQSLGRGRSAGVWAAFGVAGGSLIHSLLAAFGVSALLQQSETAFLIVKYAGAAYLLYLAWRAATDRSGPLQAALLPPRRAHRAFLDGVVTNLFNPKVALFILAFLPQFVDPARGSVAGQILFLGLLFNIGGTSVLLAVALSASAARERILSSRRAVLALRWITASLFVGLAARIALSER